MPRCFALSNEKPEETRSECPSTEITGISALKTSSPPQLLPYAQSLKFSETFRANICQGTGEGQGRPIWEMMKRGLPPRFAKQEHFPLWIFVTQILPTERVAGTPCAHGGSRDSWSQQVLGAATSSGKSALIKGWWPQLWGRLTSPKDQKSHL